MANTKANCKIGIIGLGVMGRNLLLNIADKGFAVAGYDTDLSKVNILTQMANAKIAASGTIPEFMASLASPRIILMLVPAGAPVDKVIADLLPSLKPQDILIDAGNSHYKDTEIRFQILAKQGIHFLGTGISGGEKGAREGPSLMPGGTLEAYAHVRPIFEACAAKVQADPCVAFLGPRAAGHYVKMVHNGIEYGVMQLISESYELLKRGLNLSDAELHHIYAEWNAGELNSYLIEITSHIFSKTDEKTGKLFIDEILGVAKQLGTGMWTSQSAMELQVSIPTIDLAVGIRNVSMLEAERIQANKILPRPLSPYKGDPKQFIANLGQALHAAMLITFAQGMALLHVAAEKLDYQFELETVARIWRGGCIIRAGMLEEIRNAYKQSPTLPNILLDKTIAKSILNNEKSLRKIICDSVEIGIPIPGLMSTLGYLDEYRSAWMPTNLIQAQRDYFGAHTYERTDEKGTFHTEWESK